MAPLSLKIVLGEGAVTRTIQFDSRSRVHDAHKIIQEKINTEDDGKEYGLFLTATDDDGTSGIWLEAHRTLDYYMLRDGDSLLYLCKMRNLRVRMLDGAVKTLPVDESKVVGDLMMFICHRIGLTNHEEYGLCREEVKESEEPKAAVQTGTLTLKKKTIKPRDKDVVLEQLSKKLKTDDNIEWLDQHKTLRELQVDPKETLLLKRRLYYSDRNVDSRDPVQLNLLYVQARDAILEGRHPVTEQKAVEFAAIQCQIHFGDFQEDKHKPGFIENLSEYLPEQYSSSWGIEKKILKLYPTFKGNSQIEAKYLYTKTARELPTYGVTFFLVKEKERKGKKKLVPRLLGINADAILRLDEVTKEILQVWPLTHVKSYHVAKGSTFTLNFGDYSDKEYSVKTNDAHSIRTILQDYIDLHRKRREAPYTMLQRERYAVGEEVVEASRACEITHVTNNASKIVEESFVGPTKLVPFEEGQQAMGGTQMVTVHQIVVTDRAGTKQQVMSGGVPMRADMSRDFVKKLNRVNSGSVKIVTFLTNPTEENIKEAQKVMNNMEAEIPNIVQGVKETAEKQTNEEARKKLLDELQELLQCVNSLSASMKSDRPNQEEAQETARKIADLSTQMYFSLDPTTIKRGELCRTSRKSFIADDKTDKTLRRASLISAASKACDAVDHAKQLLHQDPQNAPQLSPQELEQLEVSATDKMGKISAAVALYLTAHADPNNVDYSAAVTSMNTINELMPELTKDAKLLSCAKDGKSRQQLLDDIQALCDATKRICNLTGSEDHEKIQEAANQYATLSGKLVYTFGRRFNPDNKENEIIDLAKAVGEKTTQLLFGSNELMNLSPADPGTDELHDAGVQCAHAARDLLACAQLSAPSIHEPHCRSAITAAAESLSSSAHHLANTWRHMVEDPAKHQIGEHLRHRHNDLNKALERLKNAYADLDGFGDDRAYSPEQREGRLKFIKSLNSAKDNMKDVEEELAKPVAISSMTAKQSQQLEHKLSQNMARLTAAVEVLMTVAGDRDNPNFETAELAINTINELMPNVVKDTKALASSKDAATRQAMLDELRVLCEATQGVCASAASDPQGLNESATNLAKSSGRLLFVFNPRLKEKGQTLKPDSNALELLSQVQDLSQTSSDMYGPELYDEDPALRETNRLKFISAKNAAGNAMQIAQQELEKPIAASAVSPARGEQLARRVARLRAAVAALVQATQDDGKADYALAERAMNTINEVTPQLVKDTKTLAASKDAATRQTMLDELRALCKATQAVCASAASDTQALNESATQLADSSGKLLFVFNPRLRGKAQSVINSMSTPSANAAERLSQMQELSLASSDTYGARLYEDPAVVQANRLKFAFTRNAAKEAVNDAHHELNKAIPPTTLSPEEAAAQKRKLSDSIAQLNAAIAALIAATSDPRNPDYATAESAMNTIHELTPQVVKGSKALSSGKDDKTQQAMQEELKALCDALQAVCASAGEDDQGLNNSALKMAEASGRLLFVFNPRLKRDKGHVLKPGTRDANLVLSQVQELAESSTSMLEPQLSASEDQAQRTQFSNTLTVSKCGLEVVEAELEKPSSSPLLLEEAELVKHKLGENIAKANAAVADLVVATTDSRYPDHAKADAAVKTLSSLMPEIIKDTKSIAETQEYGEKESLMFDAKELCNVTRDIYTSLENDDGELNTAALKFADVSSHMFVTVSPLSNSDKENEISELSKCACEKVSNMLGRVHQLAEEAARQHGATLAHKSSHATEAARSLYTAAQITGHTIHEPACQSSLLSAADALSSSADDLASSWAPLVKKRKTMGDQLNKDKDELNQELDKLRKACKNWNVELAKEAADSGLARQLQGDRARRRMNFVNTTMPAITDKLDAVQRELSKPANLPRSGVNPAHLQYKMADNIARLNAAIATLLTATSDKEVTDFWLASTALDDIAEAMPEIVKDAKTLSATKDDNAKKALLDDVNELYNSTRGLCAKVAQETDVDLNEAAGNIVASSGRLYYTFSANTNPNKENKIISTCASVCERASELLSSVQELGERGRAADSTRLDAGGARLADAAKALLTSAQVTAPSIDSPHCRSALLSSVAALAHSARTLAATWTLITQQQHKDMASVLNHNKNNLDAEVDNLKALINATPPPKPARSGSAKTSNPQPPQAQGYSSAPMPKTPTTPRGRDINQEFLDRVRCEESQEVALREKPAVPERDGATGARSADDEKSHTKFNNTVKATEVCLKVAEKDLKASVSSPVASSLNADQVLSLKKRLHHNLAHSSAAVAQILTNNSPDRMNYNEASKSVQTLSELMPTITKDARLLSSSQDDKVRKAFLNDMLELCEGTRRVCHSANNDRQKLNEAAIMFGNTSTKLQYAVSVDFDPAQEKQVLSRVNVIGDSASRLAMEAARAVERAEGDVAADICDAGTKCADAAGTLVYTAKLVAPSIHHPESKTTLTKAAESLSSRLQHYSATWAPLAADTHNITIIHDMTTQATSLDNLLEELRRDVAAGKLEKRREVQKLEVENTPIRQLAAVILENAKKTSECPSIPAEKRKAYASFSNKMADALRNLDIANARCRLAPSDGNRRQELENAVQNLQFVILQSRPRVGDQQQNNVVDLTDFVNDVSCDANKLHETIKVIPMKNREILDAIEDKCDKIHKEALKLSDASNQPAGDDTGFDGILEVDQFGQECDRHIKDISSMVKNIPDEGVKNNLQEKAASLADNCNYLRFAAKSALATAQSAALDETLADLADLQNRIDHMLKPVDGDTETQHAKATSPTGLVSARAQVAACVARGGGGAAPALAAYAAHARTHTDLTHHHKTEQLKDHLNKLLQQLKTLTIATSRHVATWQPTNNPEISNNIKEIIQELENPKCLSSSSAKGQSKLLSDEDVSKLLLPSAKVEVTGNKKQLEATLQKSAGKLSSTLGTVLLSANKPDALARTLHMAALSADQLSNVARVMADKQDPMQCERIEEAAQEMRFATYNVLKTAEFVSQNPNNPGAKRKLLDASRSLNEAINKLMVVSSSSDKLRAQCGEVSRSVVYNMALATPRHTSAHNYDNTVKAIQHQDQEIQKLKSDERMSREEFSRSVVHVTNAVNTTTEYAVHCAYLLSISDQHKDVATSGPADTARLQRGVEELQQICCRLLRVDNMEQAKEDEEKLAKESQELQFTIQEAAMRSNHEELKKQLTESKQRICETANHLHSVIKERNGDVAKLTPCSIKLLDAVNAVSTLSEHPSLVPQVKTVSSEAKARSEDVLSEAKTLLTKYLELLKEVESCDDDPMTWVMFNTSRNKVIETFESLVNRVRYNGQQAGLVEAQQVDVDDDLDGHKKSYVQIQVDLANKWLQKPVPKAEDKKTGQEAVKNVLEIAQKMTQDLKGSEKEEMRQLSMEIEGLLNECSQQYNQEKCSLLMERLRELSKAIDRGVVTMVVEDLIDMDAPLADLEVLADAERDEAKRKFILEKKIAELLAQLSRVTKTARFVADANCNSPAISNDLKTSSEQAELVAPMLVQAAQKRVITPSDQAAIAHYQSLLAQYAESLSKVRDLCDQTVDPMDFVVTAGETMQRMLEESSKTNDPQKCYSTSSTITKLANRVLYVSMSSNSARRDPELQKALIEAKQKLTAVIPAPDTRRSKLPDWKDTTEQIMRTTGEVESVLGGENIFKRQPGSDQPIFAAARSLHAAVRGWSARDNDIVAAAKRMAVLMARLSEYMMSDKKRELIATSKSIVSESREVAYLARKLALECTDVRIRTNLLQVCERIPTISGQLKMLTTVKGSSLGQQGSQEDKEAMDMLVGNAENLMLSIQEVVKAAASASVKIMSQHGPKIKWVRKNFYY